MRYRRLFVVAAVMAYGAWVNAQGIGFLFHGESIPEEGNTITIPAVEDEFGFGELWCESNPGSNPGEGLILKLYSGQGANIKATLKIEHNTIDAATLKWCMGGECTILNGKTEMTKSFKASGESIPVEFDAENIRSEGYLQALLTVTSGVESCSVRIVFTNGGQTGIKAVRQTAPGSGACHSVDGRLMMNPADGAIYIIDGKKVYSDNQSINN
ncbi:MAG: hypothetical protein J5869_01590 [Bacteroidaceae bacterium]|nr:hypothetical protein [Bacteroidaceae bacterium]